MKLYRGDRLSNSTEPGRYYFDGIRSKSFGQGKPRNIIAEQLLNSIRQHICPVTPSDKLIYNATEFISFSDSKTRALYWLSDQHKIKLTSSLSSYQETRYLFELDVNEALMFPMDKSETMFKYDFSCNYDLKQPNSACVKEQLMMAATQPGTYFKSCNICNNKTITGHTVVLIDAVKYLQTYKDSSAYDGAIINAELDNEWLVLPVDKLSNFSGTTIPRADFWKAEHFIGENETRDPMEHAILGMAYDENAV
jgi:hypothetical protein